MIALAEVQHNSGRGAMARWRLAMLSGESGDIVWAVCSQWVGLCGNSDKSPTQLVLVLVMMASSGVVFLRGGVIMKLVHLHPRGVVSAVCRP